MTAESTVKNNVQLKCLCCPSIILQPGFGTLEVTQFQLPQFIMKDNDKMGGEEITRAWMVQDMFHFENVGFSNTVGNYKYLICAECEVGPIGWHCLHTKSNYIADKRVKHGE